jgi:hypothetical protein
MNLRIGPNPGFVRRLPGRMNILDIECTDFGTVEKDHASVQIEGAVTDNTFTFSLEGSVPLNVFADAVRHWNVLLSSIATSTGHKNSTFVITDLEYGSTVVTASLAEPDEVIGSQISNQVFAVGEGMRMGNVIPFPDSVQRAALALMKGVSRGQGYPLTISADDRDVYVPPSIEEKQKIQLIRNETGIATPSTTESFGSLTGRIQTLSSRDALRFTLYDSLRDRAVKGTLTPALSEQVRDLWDKNVYIEGWIVRDFSTGYPLRIKNLRLIEPASERSATLAFMEARGILKGKLNPGMSPEDRIRQVRDA